MTTPRVSTKRKARYPQLLVVVLHEAVLLPDLLALDHTHTSYL